jgi:predicted transcriptional regulator
MEFSLTDREASLMEVLWAYGPSTVAEVREQLADELAYTTVLTMLRILESKGYVTHAEEGRAHRYSAVIARDAVQGSALQSLKQKLFQGSSELLLTRLVAERDLTPAEVERIQGVLDKYLQERKKK